MSKISFYHLTKTSMEEALPQILEKILETGGRALLNCADENTLKNVDKILWAVGGTRLIPHGSANDEFPEEQPIFLSTNSHSAPNNPNFLVLLKIDDSALFEDYERSIVIFSDNDNSEKEKSRQLWKTLKETESFELQYFKQNDKGVWEKAA